MISYHSSLVSTCLHAMVCPGVSFECKLTGNCQRCQHFSSSHLEDEQQILCKVVESLIAVLWVIQVCPADLPRAGRT